MAFNLFLLVTFINYRRLPLYDNGFCFESDSWNEARIVKCELTEVIRQKNDTEFISILNSIRIGQCTTETESALAKCHVSVKQPPSDGIIPTKLYCMNRDVDRENAYFLEKLDGDLRTFKAIDVFNASTPSGAESKLIEMLNKKTYMVLPLKLEHK